MRTEGELRALLVLLSDEEERVAAAAREALLKEREASVPYLEEAAGAPDPRLRGRARLMLQEMRLALVGDQWQELACRPDEAVDLEQGCLLLSNLVRRVDEKSMAGFLDAIAGMVRAHMASVGGLQALGEVLFDNLGFKGGEYGDPENYYVAPALERRTGIPIVLATVYVLVGKRVGLPVSGVAAPSHYVARFEGSDGPVYIDCYNRGRLYRQETLEGWLAGRGVADAGRYLEPAGARFTLVRMLNNLERFYTDAGDERLTALVRRMRNQMMHPFEWET